MGFWVIPKQTHFSQPANDKLTIYRKKCQYNNFMTTCQSNYEKPNISTGFWEIPKCTGESLQVKFFIILSRISDFNVEAQNEKNEINQLLI